MEFRGKFVAIVAILLLIGWRLFLMSVLTLPLITISLFVSVAVLITWLGFQYDRIYFIATHDASTGLYNREYALQQLKSMLRNAQRLQIPLSILIIDANNLKQVNDTYGHLAGDQGIRMIARTLKSYTTTKRDVAARLGGDEFIVIHPRGDRAVSEVVANSIHYALGEQSKVSRIKMTVSIGIATFPEDADNVTDLMRIADSRMYAEKHQFHVSQRN